MNNQQHFVVEIYSANYTFEFKCTTMYEALEALTDAAETFSFPVDADETMILLVNMKNGKALSDSNCCWGIRLEDGEG